MSDFISTRDRGGCCLLHCMKTGVHLMSDLSRNAHQARHPSATLNLDYWFTLRRMYWAKRPAARCPVNPNSGPIADILRNVEGPIPTVSSLFADYHPR